MSTTSSFSDVWNLMVKRFNEWTDHWCDAQRAENEALKTENEALKAEIAAMKENP